MGEIKAECVEVIWENKTEYLFFITVLRKILKNLNKLETLLPATHLKLITCTLSETLQTPTCPVSTVTLSNWLANLFTKSIW